MSALMASVPIPLNDTDVSTLTLYLHIRADFSLFQSVFHKVNLMRSYKWMDFTQSQTIATSPFV